MRMRMVSTAQINEQRLTGVFWRAKRGHGGNGHRLDGPYSDFTACGISSPCLCFLSAGVRGAAWDFLFSSFQKGRHFFVSFLFFVTGRSRSVGRLIFGRDIPLLLHVLISFFSHTLFSSPRFICGTGTAVEKNTPTPPPPPYDT